MKCRVRFSSILFDLKLLKPINTITELFMLEGTSQGHQQQPSSSGQG